MHVIDQHIEENIYLKCFKSKQWPTRALHGNFHGTEISGFCSFASASVCCLWEGGKNHTLIP